MGKITTKKRILFSFRGQVTINGQIMSEKPGIFCAQNGQKLWVFGQPEGGGCPLHPPSKVTLSFPSLIRLLGITPKACYTLARIGSRSRRTFKVHSA